MKITLVDKTSDLAETQMKKLSSLGDLTIFQGIPKTEDELINRIGNSDIIIVGWSSITKRVISKAKNLKMISIWATGHNNVDIAAANERGVVVSNVPDYAATSVAEHTFSLLLSLVRKIYLSEREIKKGNWNRESFRGFELEGKTIGVIGVGAIGIKVVKLATCFGMKVIVFTKNPSKPRSSNIKITYVDLNTLLHNSDIVTLHVPLNNETERILGEEEFSAMKNGVIILNTSRGKVIDEAALIKALQNGKVYAAGLDVLENEPPEKSNLLLNMENVIITPHAASYTNEAVNRCTEVCIENIEKFIERKPQNIVRI